MGGVVLGGVLGLWLAPTVGIEQSFADVGSAFVFVSGSAWLIGILGCYLALRVTGETGALTTVLFLSLLLPIAPGLTVAGWPRGWGIGTWVLAIVFDLLLPVTSPLIAYLLAGLATRGRDRT